MRDRPTRHVRLQRRPHRFRQRPQEVRRRHELALAGRRRHRDRRRSTQNHVDFRSASSPAQEGPLLGAMLRDHVQERLVSSPGRIFWLLRLAAFIVASVGLVCSLSLAMDDFTYGYPVYSALQSNLCAIYMLRVCAMREPISTGLHAYYGYFFAIRCYIAHMCCSRVLSDKYSVYYNRKRERKVFFYINLH